MATIRIKTTNFSGETANITFYPCFGGETVIVNSVTMPYDFVANLNPGHWTPFDNLWLKNVQKILKKAKTNFIKQIRLVRLPKKHFIRNQTMSFENSNEDVMYEAVTDSKKSSFLVTLDQIYDLVGEEDWIHGESNCLVNLASGRTITLS